MTISAMLNSRLPLRVDRLGYWLKMRGIHARPDSTEMIERQPSGDRPDQRLVNSAVRSGQDAVITTEPAITGGVDLAQPWPAFVRWACSIAGWKAYRRRNLLANQRRGGTPADKTPDMHTAQVFFVGPTLGDSFATFRCFASRHTPILPYRNGTGPRPIPPWPNPAAVAP